MTTSVAAPTAPPTVSIGLPVYNGASGVRHALDSLLAQDFSDFELIISDNGSTDSTESICREFVARDSRIRFVRHSENRGSPWNFEFVARQARGEFFMWAAHDDSWHPAFIRECLAKLRANSSAVLCCTEINFLDAAGNPVPQWDAYKNIETIGMSPVQRIHEIFRRMGWFAWYGLMRREAVLKLPLGLSAIGFDVILLAELLLLGDFARIDERLYTFRVVPRTAEDYCRVMNVKSRATITPYADLAAAILSTVYRSPISPREKAQIFADCILTLTNSNPPWRAAITSEIFGPGSAVTDAQFAFLLALILSRSVPLSESKDNPLAEAVYRAPLTTADFLDLARRVPQSVGPIPINSTSDLSRRASQLFELGRLHESLAAFDAALRSRESSDTWSDWATVHLALNHTAEAEHGLRHALWLDPNNGHAAAKLGILLATTGRTTEAMPLLHRAQLLTTGEEQSLAAQLLADCRRATSIAHA